jgi:hypothetical protein
MEFVAKRLSALIIPPRTLLSITHLFGPDGVFLFSA